MKLTDIIQRRRVLREKAGALSQELAAVNQELEALSNAMQARLETMVVAFEGGAAYGDVAEKEPTSKPWQSKVTTMQEVIANQGVLGAIPDFLKSVAADGTGIASVVSEGKSRPRSRVKLGPEIARVMKRAGKPLTRNEIYDLLVSEGVTVPGSQPKANLSAHLSYHPDIERTDDGKWVLKGENW